MAISTDAREGIGPTQGDHHAIGAIRYVYGVDEGHGGWQQAPEIRSVKLAQTDDLGRSKGIALIPMSSGRREKSFLFDDNLSVVKHKGISWLF